MKVKLIKRMITVDHIEYSIGQIIDVSDEEGAALIAAGTVTDDLSYGEGDARVVYAQKMIFVPPLPIPLGTTAIPLASGLDLTAAGLKARITVADSNAAKRPWNDILIDLDNHKAVPGPFSYISVYDNDHIRFYIDDLETGAFRLSAHGRALELRKIELLEPLTIYV